MRAFFEYYPSEIPGGNHTSSNGHAPMPATIRRASRGNGSVAGSVYVQCFCFLPNAAECFGLSAGDVPVGLLKEDAKPRLG